MFSTFRDNCIIFDEIKKDAQRVSNMKPFINNYKWEGISYPLKTDYWERFEKIIWQLLLMFCILKKYKYVQLLFQKIIQILKNK